MPDHPNPAAPLIAPRRNRPDKLRTAAAAGKPTVQRPPKRPPDAQHAPTPPVEPTPPPLRLSRKCRDGMHHVCPGSVPLFPASGEGPRFAVCECRVCKHAYSPQRRARRR